MTISRPLDLNGDVPSQIIDRAVEVCTRERRGEPVVLLGYSLGGLIAIGVGARLVADGVPVSRLILIDTYAPPYMDKTVRYYAARLHAEIRRGRSRNGSARRTGRQKSEREAALTTNPDLWRQIIRAFVRWDPPRVSVPTLLVRSASGAQRIRPLLHRSTNGLGPCLQGSVRSASVEVDHLAMLTTGSQTVADAIARLTAEAR